MTEDRAPGTIVPLFVAALAAGPLLLLVEHVWPFSPTSLNDDARMDGLLAAVLFYGSAWLAARAYPIIGSSDVARRASALVPASALSAAVVALRTPQSAAELLTAIVGVAATLRCDGAPSALFAVVAGALWAMPHGPGGALGGAACLLVLSLANGRRWPWRGAPGADDGELEEVQLPFGSADPIALWVTCLAGSALVVAAVEAAGGASALEAARRFVLYGYRAANELWVLPMLVAVAFRVGWDRPRRMPLAVLGVVAWLTQELTGAAVVTVWALVVLGHILERAHASRSVLIGWAALFLWNPISGHVPVNPLEVAGALVVGAAALWFGEDVVPAHLRKKGYGGWDGRSRLVRTAFVPSPAAGTLAKGLGACLLTVGVLWPGRTPPLPVGAWRSVPAEPDVTAAVTVLDAGGQPVPAVTVTGAFDAAQTDAGGRATLRAWYGETLRVGHLAEAAAGREVTITLPPTGAAALRVVADGVDPLGPAELFGVVYRERDLDPPRRGARRVIEPVVVPLPTLSDGRALLRQNRPNMVVGPGLYVVRVEVGTEEVRLPRLPALYLRDGSSSEDPRCAAVGPLFATGSADSRPVLAMPAPRPDGTCVIRGPQVVGLTLWSSHGVPVVGPIPSLGAVTLGGGGVSAVASTRAVFVRCADAPDGRCAAVSCVGGGVHADARVFCPGLGAAQLIVDGQLVTVPAHVAAVEVLPRDTPRATVHGAPGPVWLSPLDAGVNGQPREATCDHGACVARGLTAGRWRICDQRAHAAAPACHHGELVVDEGSVSAQWSP